MLRLKIRYFILKVQNGTIFSTQIVRYHWLKTINRNNRSDNSNLNTQTKKKKGIIYAFVLLF